MLLDCAFCLWKCKSPDGWIASAGPFAKLLSRPWAYRIRTQPIRSSATTLLINRVFVRALSLALSLRAYTPSVYFRLVFWWRCRIRTMCALSRTLYLYKSRLNKKLQCLLLSRLEAGCGACFLFNLFCQRCEYIARSYATQQQTNNSTPWGNKTGVLRVVKIS